MYYKFKHIRKEMKNIMCLQLQCSRAFAAFPKNENNYGSVVSSAHLSPVRKAVKTEPERVKLKDLYC